MNILFPYLARWNSANRSRYHHILTHLCRLGHKVYVMNAPPMALNDISARDMWCDNGSLTHGMTVSELHAPQLVKSFWKKPIRRTKLLKKGLISLTSISQIRRFIDREKIDLLLLYNLPQAPLLQLAQCRTHFDMADDLVSMMEIEDNITASAGGRLAACVVQKYMISHAGTVSVASSVLKEKIDRPVMTLPNGADTAELADVDGSAWRRLCSEPSVGFVGAFEYWLDFKIVLSAARRLPGVRFVLVGNGRQMNFLLEEIKKFDLENVHLTGALPYKDAMNYIAGMDVCIMPFSRGRVSDGSCPLKLFEYAALGKPIVSTSITEVKRIGNGWIEFADDEADFAGAIDNFLCNPGLAGWAGETGKAVVEQHYSWPVLVRQFENLLLKGSVPAIELQEPSKSRVKAFEYKIYK